jgi:pimeloyl-ACP methyl ester carboxylesterase
VLETRRIDGRTVTFRREAGRAPALVCIHGSADNHHVYDRLLDALPERSRYSIDLPGRAGTDGPPLATVAEMERFVSRVLESEVRGDYLLAGHSLGGAVALEHALVSQTERLKGIVLLATGARLRVHPLILQIFDQAAGSGMPLPVPPGLYERGGDPDVLAEATHKRERTPVETGAVDWRAADAFDRMQDLGNIRVPALVIGGTNDALTPAKYAEYLAAHIPDAQLHIMEGAGHMLVMERAAEASKLIEGFVSSLRI